MDPLLPVVLLSVVLGATIAFLIFRNYFRKQKSEVESLAKAEVNNANYKKAPKQPQSFPKKSHSKHQHHSHAPDKDQNKRHHPLDLNTVKGHGDSVGGLCFSSDGRSLATGDFNLQSNLFGMMGRICHWLDIGLEFIHRKQY